MIASLVVRASKAAPCATKKNSQRIIRLGRFSKILPSKAFMRFQENCTIDGWDGVTITEDLCASVRFYPPKQNADIDGLLASLFDVLQHYKVVANDKQFKKLLDVEILQSGHNGGRFEIDLFSYAR